MTLYLFWLFLVTVSVSHTLNVVDFFRTERRYSILKRLQEATLELHKATVDAEKDLQNAIDNFDDQLDYVQSSISDLWKCYRELKNAG